MKNSFFILILILGTNSFAQNSFMIDFGSEKNIFDSDYHIYTNDSLIYTNCSIKNDYEALDNLNSGKYLIRYNTIFGIDSLIVDLDGNEGVKFITLETENITESQLSNTVSEIESLKNNEIITLKYIIGGCFVSEEKEISITKEKNKFYKIKNGKQERINSKIIQKIIRYEKILRNLNIEENIDGTVKTVTCSESISLEKENKNIFGKNIFCGDWNKSSEIKEWIE